MTIKELQEEKLLLELNIEKLITEFQVRSGCSVSSIAVYEKVPHTLDLVKPTGDVVVKLNA